MTSKAAYDTIDDVKVVIPHDTERSAVMAFKFDEDRNKSATKVYWTLSEYAQDVITSDWDEFDKQQSIPTDTRYSERYNKTFQNYCKYAFCSRSPEISEKITSENISAVCSLQFSIIKETYLSETGDKQNYKFSKKTKDMIIEMSDGNYLTEIYEGEKKYARYFRAVLEEYARLPKFKREKFLYIDKFEKIEKQLNKDYEKTKPIIVNTYSSGYDGKLKRSRFIVYPYKLKPGRSLLHYYLVGMGRKMGEDGKFEPFTLRLTNIESVDLSVPLDEKTLSGRDLRVSKVTELDKRLDRVDVPYINSAPHDCIRVKFSDNGLALLHRIMHNRPDYEKDKDDDHIRIFKCTELEIINYLHAFGGDAVVLGPELIRNKMKEFYEKARNAYK